MDEIKTYHWKELTLNGKYIDAASTIILPRDINDNALSSIIPFFKDAFLTPTFLEEYHFFTISSSAKNLIDTLLEDNKIYNLNSAFYLLSAIFQKEYINYYEHPPIMGKLLYKDYENIRNDLEKLLDILYIKLTKDNSAIKSVSFKIKKLITLNNFFIVSDILDALIIHYDLDLENFEKRKLELIEETNNIKLELIDEYQKWLLIKSLYDYISKEKPTVKVLSEDIRFVGTFMHISQIPINKTHFEVSLKDGVNTIMSENEIKYLRTFLTRPKSFFLK